jgi:hypothetical protein
MKKVRNKTYLVFLTELWLTSFHWPDGKKNIPKFNYILDEFGLIYTDNEIHVKDVCRSFVKNG